MNESAELDSDSKLDVTLLTDIELGVRLTRAWDANQLHDLTVLRAEWARRQAAGGKE